jgi:exopolyphosphatase/guanosine-5'-triphosphate,3'-diphosphate pyrophosphatase
LAVTAELLSMTDARSVRVSAFGLREGLLLEMVGDGTGPVADPLRPLREFVERCQGDRRHVEQVRTLALSLFDQLGDTLGCEDGERWLLEAAGLLHDVGQMVSYRQHHRHSYQLIMHADRLNLSARDRTLVALISRYHRKKGPSRKHDEFTALPADEQAVVRRLSALLRVADGLDRGHTSIVEKVRTRLMDHRLSIRVVPRLAGADVSLECWGAERKADVLSDLLDREVTVAAAVV